MWDQEHFGLTLDTVHVVHDIKECCMSSIMQATNTEVLEADRFSEPLGDCVWPWDELHAVFGQSNDWEDRMLGMNVCQCVRWPGQSATEWLLLHAGAGHVE